MKFPVSIVVVTLLTSSVCLSFPNLDGFDSLDNFQELIQQQLDSILSQLDLNKQLGELLDEAKNLSRSLDQVSHCYDAELNNQSVNIFDADLDFASVVDNYYQAFYENEISEQSVQNLLQATRDIIQLCLNVPLNHTTRYGFTSLSDKSESEFRDMKGVKIPEDGNQTELSNRRKRSIHFGNDEECNKTSTNAPDHFDWRSFGKVMPPKNQRQCGSCWAFASSAAMESAYLIQKNLPYLYLSQQEIVDCAPVNGRSGCDGAYGYLAFQYSMQSGLTEAYNRPYQARMMSCQNSTTPRNTQVTNFCLRSRYNYGLGSDREYLSDEAIRQALFNYGPLYILVNVASMRHYRNGVINDSSCPSTPNHAVLLVGYTPNEWIIKNSWGTGWGEKGYFRVVRGKNMCGINSEIIYPTSVRSFRNSPN